MRATLIKELEVAREAGPNPGDPLVRVEIDLPYLTDRQSRSTKTCPTSSPPSMLMSICRHRSTFSHSALVNWLP